jgi:hypothetical protein
MLPDVFDDPDVVVADEPIEAVEPIAIGRAPTKPELQGTIRVDFEDSAGIAYFAELIARMARLGKPVEISIRIIDE